MKTQANKITCKLNCAYVNDSEGGRCVFQRAEHKNKYSKGFFPVLTNKNDVTCRAEQLQPSTALFRSNVTTARLH
jgi:hypothetical protein